MATESSNSPFRLENESDCSSLMAFLGQMRDRLVLFLADGQERIVPDIMSWESTQWDLNKDIQIDYLAQIVGLKIQLIHAFRLFCVYVKSKGRDIVCWVEESVCSKDRSAVETISDIFNPVERFETRMEYLSRKVDHLSLFYGSETGSTNEVAHNKSLSIEKVAHKLSHYEVLGA